jgi:hypothetical protein
MTMRSHGWKCWCGVVLLGVGVALFLQFRHRRCYVEFVVPNGFHGVFVVKEDPVSGAAPEREGDLVRYVIPESGVLITADAEPLLNWHTPSARFANGEKISNLAEDRYILIGLSNDVAGRMKWLIGSPAEAQQYWKDRKVWFEIEAD